MIYDKLPEKSRVAETAASLRKKGYAVFLRDKKDEALEIIKKIIPAGASVMSGSSVTLEQIGYINLLKTGKHNWTDLHKKVRSENDPDKRRRLRKQATLSDFYLGSVHALTRKGEFIIASNTGSQLPHIVFNSANLIFVAGAQKIVPDMETGMKRLEKYVVPLENERMMQKFGVKTMLSKIIIFKKENPSGKRKINFIIVKEKLGF